MEMSLSSNKKNIKTQDNFVYQLLCFLALAISLMSTINALGLLNSNVLSAIQAMVVVTIYSLVIILRKKIRIISLILIIMSYITLVLNNAPYMISVTMLIMITDIIGYFPNIDYKKILGIFFTSSLLLFCSIVVLYYLFNFNNHDVEMWRIDKIIHRKSLGFIHPNIASMIWVSIFFAYCGLVGQKYSRFKYLLIAFLSLVILNQTQSRTSMYVLITISFIYIVLGKNIDKAMSKNFSWIIYFIPILLTVLSIYVLFTPINNVLNELLSGRIQLYQSFYQEYGIHLLKTSELESAMFDNGYLQALLAKGILFLIELLIVYLYILKSYSVYTVKQWILFIGYFAMGFTETALQHFELILPILMITAINDETLSNHK
ncbi:hypothetical protein C5L23_000914 [Leuconostoc fallax]|uniref:Polysaccharide polymerase n=3 Tax=Leuconostoc fallax TaxID=1251 RepID=A0A4R5NAD7_9LACO|nr:hypothetical protein C5L23_000914 [Leuconostoc fallax]